MFGIIFSFLSGIGVFLFAIFQIDKIFSNEIQLPKKIEKQLQRPMIFYFLGLFFSAITQSSSAINSILATLRDKDKIKEKATYLAVAGSNVGTTITAYLASIQSKTITTFFASIIFFSTLFLLLIKKEKLKKIAILLCGFSLIFVSFGIIKNNIPQLLQYIDFSFLQSKNPFIPFLLIMIFTSLCQSSSLVSVILVSFAHLNLIPVVNALFMIMAANLGTCSTIFLVSIGKTQKSFRVAMFNLLFNLIPTIVFVVLYYLRMLDGFINLNVSIATKIALFHTIFNIGSCVLICPFIDIFIKIDKNTIMNKIAIYKNKLKKYS